MTFCTNTVTVITHTDVWPVRTLNLDCRRDDARRIDTHRVSCTNWLGFYVFVLFLVKIPARRDTVK